MSETDAQWFIQLTSGLPGWIGNMGAGGNAVPESLGRPSPLHIKTSRRPLIVYK